MEANFNPNYVKKILINSSGGSGGSNSNSNVVNSNNSNGEPLVSGNKK